MTTPDWNRVFAEMPDVVRLIRITGAKLLPLLSLWANMDTEPDRADAEPRQRSLYEQVFQNPALGEQAIAAFDLQDANPRYIRDYRPALQAALGVSGLDLHMLELAEFGGVSEANDADKGPEISLENLSKLYRQTVLAKALRIPIRELLAWQRLLPSRPFIIPSETVAFAQRVRETSEAGIDPDQALYYFKHDPEAAARLSLDEGNLAQLIWELRGALQEAGVNGEEQPTLMLPLREFLGRIHPDVDSFDDLYSVIAGTSKKSSQEKEALVDQYLAVFLDANEAKTKLIYARDAEVESGWAYVEKAAQQDQREKSLKNALRQAQIAPVAQSLVRTHGADRPQTETNNGAVNRSILETISYLPECRMLVEAGGKLVGNLKEENVSPISTSGSSNIASGSRRSRKPFPGCWNSTSILCANCSKPSQSIKFACSTFSSPQNLLRGKRYSPNLSPIPW
jgi:hypothetical protein